MTCTTAAHPFATLVIHSSPPVPTLVSSLRALRKRMTSEGNDRGVRDRRGGRTQGSSEMNGTLRILPPVSLSSRLTLAASLPSFYLPPIPSVTPFVHSLRDPAPRGRCKGNGERRAPTTGAGWEWKEEGTIFTLWKLFLRVNSRLLVMSF